MWSTISEHLFAIIYSKGELPSDPVEARKIKTRGARFTVIYGMLYKRGLHHAAPKIFRSQDAEFTLSEVHGGACGEHLGASALATKIMRAGFFWPTLRHDALKKVKECDKCQRHAPIQSAPISELQPIFQPIPFVQWVWIY